MRTTSFVEFLTEVRYYVRVVTDAFNLHTAEQIVALGYCHVLDKYVLRLIGTVFMERIRQVR